MSDKVMKSKRVKQANKSSKPLLERQRRARINTSLNELKHLVLSSLYQDCPQAEKNGEKMEKAEILELTVNFLKLAKSRRHFGLRAAEIGKYNMPNHNVDCFARIENTQTHQVLTMPAHVQQAISPCSMAGQTPIDNTMRCGVHPCLGYQISPSLSPVPQLSPVPSLSSKVMPASRYQQATSIATTNAQYLHVRPTNKVQVWRPW
ncbi:hypothetical protein QZH41_015408 [Actinostola sp. cb2023]|nr:hypothetical protein QZH41_015408 [Actinostola sp. cb2023]